MHSKKESWHFCYWDEQMVKDIKPKTKENGTTSNTSGKKNINKTKES